ncbi:MAG: putative methyltransferase, partial [Gammaproteobacteria bacterium]
MRKIIYVLGLTLLANVAVAGPEEVEAKIKLALAADIRGSEEKSRDKNRKPLETLSFFGLDDGMNVLEILPGGGWYTKILAPVLHDKGTLYEALGVSRVKQLSELPGFGNIEILETGAKIEKPPGEPLYTVSDFDLGIDNLDMVFTFRNYHNFNAEGRKAINDAVFEALKSGGVYAVVDHTRRHMQNLNIENNRRVDPVLVIKEIQESGFKFDDYSTIHYRPDDELRFEVGRKTVTGNTDRFTLKF